MQWKGRNEIACSCCLPVEELFINPNDHGAAPSFGFESAPEPLATAQHELVVSQPAVAKSVSEAVGASNNGGSTSTSILDEIGNLLMKVESLSHKIPSTADRLSKIAGLFPPGHGPSADAIEQQGKHEGDLLDNLRNALSYMHTGFSLFGKQQDSVCKDYERESTIIETQIREQDLAADKSNPLYEACFIGEIVLGQSAAEAEVIEFMSFFHVWMMCIY